MKELVEVIAKSLVDFPDEVVVTESENEKGTLRLFMRVPMAFRFICIEFPANLYFIKYLSNALAYQKTGKLKQNVKEKFCNTWNIYNIKRRKVL